MGIYCMFLKCKSSKNAKKLEKGVFFIPIPKPSTDIERCRIWLAAVNRKDINNATDVKSNHHVCSKHFIGGKGPTIEYPDPVPDPAPVPDPPPDFNKEKAKAVCIDHSYSKKRKTLKLPLEVCVENDQIHQDCEISGILKDSIETDVMAKTAETNTILIEQVHSSEEARKIYTSNNFKEAYEPDITETNTTDITEPVLSNNDPEISEVNKQMDVTEPDVSISIGEKNTILIEQVHSSEEARKIYASNNFKDAYEPDIAETNSTDITEQVLSNNDPGISAVHKQMDMTEPDVLISNGEKNTTDIKQDTYIDRSYHDTDNEQSAVFSCKELVKQFLKHTIENIESEIWFFEPKQYSECVSFKKNINGNNFLKIEISSHLEVTILVSNNIIPPMHSIYSNPDMNRILTSKIYTLAELLNVMSRLNLWTVCQGVTGDIYSKFKNEYLVTAKVCELTQSIRSANCEYLFLRIRSGDKCKACRLKKRILQKRFKRIKGNTFEPKLTTNLKFMERSEVRKRFEINQSQNLALKRRIKQLEHKIRKKLNQEAYF